MKNLPIIRSSIFLFRYFPRILFTTGASICFGCRISNQEFLSRKTTDKSDDIKTKLPPFKQRRRRWNHWPRTNQCSRSFEENAPWYFRYATYHEAHIWQSSFGWTMSLIRRKSQIDIMSNYNRIKTSLNTVTFYIWTLIEKHKIV